MAKKKIQLSNYAFEITDVEIENHQASGETVTAVTITIYKGDEVVEAGKRLGFSGELAEDEIVAELTKVVEAIANDHRVAAESAQVEAQTEKANTLKENLSGQRVEVATNSQTDDEIE